MVWSTVSREDVGSSWARLSDVVLLEAKTGSRSAPWKADHCLIRSLPHQKMCEIIIDYYETGDEAGESKE